jgi:N-acetylmuramoyl-L-alanine amidase
VEEKTVTRAVALDLLPLLGPDGFTVVKSRVADSPVARLGPESLSGGAYTPDGEHADTQTRVDCANAAGAQLLLFGLGVA